MVSVSVPMSAFASASASTSTMHLCVFFSFFPPDPGQSISHVPLQVNRFQKIILLIVRYKYLTSSSRRFYSLESDPPHKIMRYVRYSSTQL